MKKRIMVGYGLCFLLGLGGSGAIFSYIMNEKLNKFHQTNTIRRVNNFSPMPTANLSNYIPTFQATEEFEQAAAASVNAVVYVSTKVSNSDSYLGLGDLFGTPQRGSGSGVIISDDGYIVTNNHVIEDASEIIITLNNKTEHKAKVIATDANTDLAVIKIDAIGLQTIKFGNSDDVRVGQWVLAVGNPFNLTSTVTAGIVSAKARNIGILRGQNGGKNGQDYSIESFLQTDAAVNPGNSGGALVSLKGELIGLNTAIATETGSFSGYSFAIPANLVRKVVNDLIHYGTVQRGFIGVSIQDLDARTAQKHNLQTLEGAYVTGIAANGAARAAGLKEGDLIVSIHGKKISSASELQEQIANYNPGDAVQVQVLRDNQPLTLVVTLRNLDGTTDKVEKTAFFNESTSSKKNATLQEIGAAFSEPTTAELRRRDLNYGVKVTEIRKGGRFHSLGIEKGFIITAIDKAPVLSPKDVIDKIESAEHHVYIEGYKTNGKKSYYILSK